MSSPTVRLVASSSDFGSLSPFVPAVDARGAALFAARRADDSSAIVRADEDGARVCAEPDAAIDSHPAADGTGRLCFFAGGALWRSAEGALTKLTPPDVSVGPLGPTANAAGSIAFRASQGGTSGIWLWRDGACRHVAEAGDQFTDFRGLPCVDGRDRVVFRASLADGSEGLYRWDAGSVTTLLVTGRDIAELGGFVSMNERGLVALGGRLGGGGATVLLFDDDGLTPLHIGRFDMVRGALLDATGRLTILAMADRALGVYASDETGGDVRPLLTLGDRIANRTVTEFALNAVSKNAGGQLAARVAYLDGGEAIALLVDGET